MSKKEILFEQSQSKSQVVAYSDMLDEKEIKIYPNPTKGFFKVETKSDIEEFLMYDYTGKILLRKSNLSKGSNSFDISSYPNSVYVIRLKYGTESETFKLIKN
jgi:hypothetical protein